MGLGNVAYLGVFQDWVLITVIEFSKNQSRRGGPAGKRKYRTLGAREEKSLLKNTSCFSISLLCQLAA